MGTHAQPSLPCPPARCSHPVILYGEPGLRKEHLAALIHYSSPARDLPLVKVDCQATADVAAALFGAAGGEAGGDGGLLHSLAATGGTLLLNNVHLVGATDPPVQATGCDRRGSCHVAEMPPCQRSLLHSAGQHVTHLLCLHIAFQKLCTSRRTVHHAVWAQVPRGPLRQQLRQLVAGCAASAPPASSSCQPRLRVLLTAEQPAGDLDEGATAIKASAGRARLACVARQLGPAAAAASALPLARRRGSVAVTAAPLELGRILLHVPPSQRAEPQNQAGEARRLSCRCLPLLRRCHPSEPAPPTSKSWLPTSWRHTPAVPAGPRWACSWRRPRCGETSGLGKLGHYVWPWLYIVRSSKLPNK